MNFSTRVPFLAYVPGRGATDFYIAMVGKDNALTQHFYHEEIAYTAAHGAALSGATSVLFIKSHGAAKAMNSIVASMYTKTVSPMVVFVFEDSLGGSSDHPFVGIDMLRGVGATVIQVDEKIEEFALNEAFTQASQTGVPVFISLDIAKPFFTENFKVVLQAKLDTSFPLLEGKEGDRFLNPLMSPRFFGKLEKAPHIPGSIPPPLLSSIQAYIPIVDKLRTIPYDWITGDAGTSSLFALAPYYWTKVCTHMGGALPLALGARASGLKRVLSTSGDFSFISTASVTLTECLRRGISLDVLVFANGFAAATGGQKVTIQEIKNQIPSEISMEVFSIEESRSTDAIRQYFLSPSAKIRVAVALVST